MRLDDELFAAAAYALGLPGNAGEWLISPDFGLGGEIPAVVGQTAKGKDRVIQLLGRMEYNIP